MYIQTDLELELLGLSSPILVAVFWIITELKFPKSRYHSSFLYYKVWRLIKGISQNRKKKLHFEKISLIKIKYINHVSSMRHNSHIKIAEINKIRAVKFLKLCMKLKRIEFCLKINSLGFSLVNILYNLFISRLEAQTLIHPNPISKRDFSGSGPNLYIQNLSGKEGSGPKLSIPNPLGKEYTDLFFSTAATATTASVVMWRRICQSYQFWRPGIEIF